MTAPPSKEWESFDIEMDEEGVARVLGHDPDEVMTFTVRDFGRFLTEFISTMCEGDEE